MVLAVSLYPSISCVPFVEVCSQRLLISPELHILTFILEACLTWALLSNCSHGIAAASY